jgi:lysozyme
MDVIAMLKRHEGFRSKPYRCTEGALTIGYGLNLDAGISKREADVLLRERVQMVREELIEKLPFFLGLSEERQAVLIDMGYNMDVSRLLKFVRTLYHIEHKQYKEAAAAMLESKWAGQVGDRAIELAYIMEGNDS